MGCVWECVGVCVGGGVFENRGGEGRGGEEGEGVGVSGCGKVWFVCVCVCCLHLVPRLTLSFPSKHTTKVSRCLPRLHCLLSPTTRRSCRRSVLLKTL